MAADTVSREDSGTDLKMSQEIFGCTTSEYLLKGLEEYLSSALEDALEEADEEEIVSFEAIENALDKADGITGIGYWAKIEWSQNKDPVQYLQFGDKKNIYELELGGEHRYTVEVYSTHVLDRGEAAGFKIYNPTDGGEIYEVQENKEEVLRDQVNIVSAHRT